MRFEPQIPKVDQVGRLGVIKYIYQQVMIPITLEVESMPGDF